MKRCSWILTLILCSFLLAACGGTPPSGESSANNHRQAETRPSGQAANGSEVTLVASVAASMTDAMSAAEAAFVAKHPDIRLQFNFGSSGTLSKQIQQGAPVDLFISAGQAAMEELVQSGAVLAEAVQPLATNRVVLITSNSNLIDLHGWEDLASDLVTFIAIGDPAHVPAGQYGKEVLESLRLWDKVEKKLVFDQNVREVLHHVETGSAQVGIVYSTDAATTNKVKIIAEAPAGSHEPIVYPMSVVHASAQQEEAQLFIDFLRSEEGQVLLEPFGFGAVH